MDKQTKHKIKAQQKQLSELVNAWDPAGLIAAGCPPDEYDCITDVLLSRLHRKESQNVITEFLKAELADHYGVSTDANELDEFAARAQKWFNRQ